MHNYEAENLGNSAPARNPSTKGENHVRNVAIVGARGYSGLELSRLVLKHPRLKLAGCFANETKFQLDQYLPESRAAAVPTWSMNELEAKLGDKNLGIDLIFLATPAEVSAEIAPKAIRAGVDVIDLSGAFRLQMGTQQERLLNYQTWYGFEHPAPEYLLQAQFGLRPHVSPKASQGQGRLVANPGCYPTSILMAILPLLRSGLIKPESLVIDAKSGTSGAGRKANESLLFTEVDGECRPYKVAQHQHWPEIVQATKFLTGVEIAPFFTTHLLNVRRGIISSIYARLQTPMASEVESEARVEEAFRLAYHGYPLVEFGSLRNKENERLLSLKRVVGSGRTQLSYRVDGDKLYVFSLIDNLLKGAASQALENLNCLYDWPLHLGIEDAEGVL